MQKYLGLPAAIHLPHVACREIKIARPPDVDKRDSEDEGQNDGDFEPDASGCRITLADGVESRLRFRKVLGLSAAEEIRLVPEFRDVLLDTTCGVEVLAGRVLEYFSVPHMEIKFSATGRLTFQGLLTSFSVQCAFARDASETKRAALGCWPLALGCRLRPRRGLRATRGRWHAFHA